MKKISISVLILSFTISLVLGIEAFLCAGELYRWVDKNGVVHFSNVPVSGHVDESAVIKEEPEFETQMVRKGPYKTVFNFEIKDPENFNPYEAASKEVEENREKIFKYYFAPRGWDSEHELNEKMRKYWREGLRRFYNSALEQAQYAHRTAIESAIKERGAEEGNPK
ncbi:MAG: DUF4124 domain-containing protein [Desulfobacterales bacterium]|nr:DUF4124 domain-containing protein [Desulfobacterales bacterium]